jgi:hypothetical protein
MARGKRASSSASDTNHLAGDSLTESFSPSGGAFETESSQISKVARGRPSRDMQGGAATSFEDEARKAPSKLKATVTFVGLGGHISRWYITALSGKNLNPSALAAQLARRVRL